MTKRNDFKRFRVIPDVGVYDELTGNISSTHRELCSQLNYLSEKADHNAELYYDKKSELEWQYELNDILKEKLRVWFNVLNKYNIHTAEKLDQVLRNERVW